MRSLVLVSIILCLALKASAQKPHHCIMKTCQMFFPHLFKSILGIGSKNLEILKKKSVLCVQGYYDEIMWDKLSSTKKRLYSIFQPMQIFSDATFMTQMILGSSSGAGMGLLVSSWTGPIAESRNIERTIAFVVLSTRISDPMDFVPPFFCDREVNGMTGETEDFISALQSGRSLRNTLSKGRKQILKLNLDKLYVPLQEFNCFTIHILEFYFIVITFFVNFLEMANSIMLALENMSINN
uniref:Uncharacterized protein n=1 Tax=Esox lucius TaxID=8010 RepID=A0AAY5KLZ6_ESOLU